MIKSFQLFQTIIELWGKATYLFFSSPEPKAHKVSL